MIKNQNFLFKNKENILVTLLSIIIFFIVLMSTVDHSVSDPKGSLLLSQNIIENNTTKLDKYVTYIDNITTNYRFIKDKENGHLYYYFPLGTPISSIPFVFIATKVFNMKMELHDDDSLVQKYIASFVSVFIFILLIGIANLYFNKLYSPLIAFTFWLGTSLSSTLGQALWSQVFSSFYAFLALYLMLKIVKENKQHLWILFSFTIFMAYLTRPTLSLLAITVILYLFLNNKKIIAIKTALLVSFFLGLFILFSFHEYDRILPHYYTPDRLHSDTFWTAFYGNLLSPARGLLVFSPFLILILINYKAMYFVFIKNKPLIIFSFWFFLHLIIISNFPHWWAGGSYGARFMIDVLPAIYLIIINQLNYITTNPTIISQNFNIILLVITLAISIFINTYQGLYNEYSGYLWNSYPNIDKNPKYLFDWKYPPFLHTEERHKERINEYQQVLRKTGEVIKPSDFILFPGVSLPTEIGTKEANGVIARQGINSPGYITFGPYRRLATGQYQLEISYESTEKISHSVGVWDVSYASEKIQSFILKGDIYGTNGESGLITRNFTIPIKFAGKTLEVRNYYSGIGTLLIKHLKITRIK